MEVWDKQDTCHGDGLHLNLSDESSLNITDFNSSVIDDVADIVEVHNDDGLFCEYSNAHSNPECTLDSQHLTTSIVEQERPKLPVEKPKRKQSFESVRGDDRLEFSEMDPAQYESKREQQRSVTIPFNAFPIGVYKMPFMLSKSVHSI